jgi:hypothetical protein
LSEARDPTAEAAERYFLRRRAWGGIITAGAGLAMLAVGSLLMVWMIQGRFRFEHHPPLRSIVLLWILGLSALAFAFKVFRGGYVDERGAWVDRPRVPWRIVLTRAGGLAIVGAAIVAWPLGLYRRGPDVSTCYALLQPDELSAIAHASLVAHDNGNDLECTITLSTNDRRPAASVHVRHSELYDGWIRDQLARTRDSHAPETQLYFGDSGVVIHDRDWSTIAFLHGGRGAKVSLGPVFHDAEVAQVLELLKARLTALE